MDTTILSEIKSKITSELKPLMPDILVHVTPFNAIVHVTDAKTMSGETYYPYGQRAYIGMQEACIWVYWDRFYDRICGNGWMYGRDRVFKFDNKDGDCKYYNTPTYISDIVNDWIIKIKSEMLQLDTDFKAHQELGAMR